LSISIIYLNHLIPKVSLLLINLLIYLLIHHMWVHWYSGNISWRNSCNQCPLMTNNRWVLVFWLCVAEYNLQPCFFIAVIYVFIVYVIMVEICAVFDFCHILWEWYKFFAIIIAIQSCHEINFWNIVVRCIFELF
jgi:hypothetical protein